MGIIVCRFDINKIYVNSGLLRLVNEYELALQGRNGLGSQGEFFYGNEQILKNNPLSFSISFSGGQWQMYASPKAGWHPPASAIWPLRLAIILFCVLFAGCFWFFLKMLERQYKVSEC